MAENQVFQFRKDSGETSRPGYKNPEQAHLRCRHVGHLEVDEDARRVTCKLCGRELDACAVAILWMNKESQLDWRVKRIKEFEAKEREREEKAEARRMAKYEARRRKAEAG